MSDKKRIEDFFNMSIEELQKLCDDRDFDIWIDTKMRDIMLGCGVD